MVRRYRLLADPFTERAGDAFRESSRIDEHERRPVLSYQFGNAVVVVRRRIAAEDRFERYRGQFDREIPVAHVTLVDDRATRRVGRIDRVCADEKTRNFIDRLLRRRQTNAQRRLRVQGRESLETQTQVGSALVARERVDLVDDDRAHTTEHLATTVARQQDIE